MAGHRMIGPAGGLRAGAMPVAYGGMVVNRGNKLAAWIANQPERVNPADRPAFGSGQAGAGPPARTITGGGAYSPSPPTAKPLGPRPVDDDVPAILAR